MGFNFFCYFDITWIWVKVTGNGLKQPILGMGWNMSKSPAWMFSLSLELLPKKPLRTRPRKAKRADFSRNMAWVHPASCRTSCLPLASLILYQCQCCIRLYGLIWSPTGSTDLELVKINASFGCRPSGGPDLRCLQNLDSQFYFWFFWYIFGIYSLLICVVCFSFACC